MTRAFLGLGTNLGDRRGELLRAVTTLEKTGELVGVSNLYETEPVGGPPQDPFLNIVVALETTQTPEELLATCQALETTAERIREFHFAVDLQPKEYVAEAFLEAFEKDYGSVENQRILLVRQACEPF